MGAGVAAEGAEADESTPPFPQQHAHGRLRRFKCTGDSNSAGKLLNISYSTRLSSSKVLLSLA